LIRFQLAAKIGKQGFKLEFKTICVSRSSDKIKLYMKLYRFSPIKTEKKLFEAIKHIHFGCYKLCKQAFGLYLPNAGNIGIFCHYDQEYDQLIKIRKELTEGSNNVNQKYFKLHKSMIIPA
jgi:hypothetical protein